MKSMMLTGIRQMEMKEIPEPVITGPHEVKIKMAVLGICGSDIHYYTQGKIGSQQADYPYSVGHEGAGIVVETGSAVTRVKIGDKIAIEPALPCGSCDQCRSDRSHTCRNIRFLGTPGQAGGCLAEYLVMPEKNCYPLPGNLTLDHGSASEPMAIGVYSVKKAGTISGLKIGILGFGPIGLSVFLASKAGGIDSAFISDKINDRLKTATSEGAVLISNPMEEDTVSIIKEKEPLGLDVVFECCGQQEAFDQAVDILKPGGKLMVIGIPEFDRWSVNVETTRRHEIMIQFIRRQVDCVDRTIELMESGKINIKNMITHRFDFEKTKEAFDLVAGYRDGVMKAVIDFNL